MKQWESEFQAKLKEIVQRDPPEGYREWLPVVGGEEIHVRVFERNKIDISKGRELFKVSFTLHIPFREYDMGYGTEPLYFKYWVDYNGGNRYNMGIFGEPGSGMPFLGAQIEGLHTDQGTDEIAEWIALQMEDIEKEDVQFRQNVRMTWGPTRYRWMAYAFVDIVRCDWFFRGGRG